MVSSLSVFQLLIPEYDTLFPSPLKRRSETEFIILSVVWSGGIGCYLLCRSKAFVKIDEVAFIIVAVSILYAYFSFHNCFSPFPFSTCWFDFFFFFKPGYGYLQVIFGHVTSCKIFFILHISIPSVYLVSKLSYWIRLSVEQYICSTITFLLNDALWVLYWFSSLTWFLFTCFLLVMIWSSDNRARRQGQSPSCSVMFLLESVVKGLSFFVMDDEYHHLPLCCNE